MVAPNVTQSDPSSLETETFPDILAQVAGMDNEINHLFVAQT